MSPSHKSFRSPMGRVRFLGSARLGTDDMWRLHVTAAFMIPLTFAFVWLVLSLLRKDYNGVRAELGQPIPAIVLLLFVLTGLYHMQIGLRAIILDYIHGHTKEWLLIANAFFALAVATACVYSVLRIGFV